jgi:cytochrome c556
MKGKLVLLTALVLTTAGIARAEEMNVILLRQAGQDLLAGTFGGIRAVVAAKGDVKTLAQPATAMGKWMRVFPSTFPAGSDKGNNTKALPVIWTDMAGFQKAANDMAEATDKLAQLAKADDADGVTAQVKVVGEACAACHRTYRAK